MVGAWFEASAWKVTAVNEVEVCQWKTVAHLANKGASLGRAPLSANGLVGVSIAELTSPIV
jgi:hypothetical protein